MIKEITSVNNSYIKEILTLKEKQVRIQKQLFIVEGYHLVEEALKHKVLKAVLCSDINYLNQIAAEEKYLVTDVVIKKISSTKNPQNVIGIVKSITNADLNHIIEKEKLRLIILDNVNDPGNLGTIIRTAAALGVEAVISSEETVDYYNDKVLRATQGAIFKVPLFKGNLKEFIKLLKEKQVLIYGTSLKNALKVNEVSKSCKLGIIVGNEAQGVSDDILALTDKNIILPMENDVESLNVSIAAALLMWELR